MKKKNIIYLSVLVTVVILVVFIIKCVQCCFETRQEKADRFLSRDIEQVGIIVDFLQSIEDDCVYIYNSEGYIFRGYKDKIEDKCVLKSIKRLFESQNYKRITKSGKTIAFQLWTRLNDFEAGICYTTDNTPAIEFLTCFTSLSVQNWYYYEADYNKWRTTA